MKKKEGLKKIYKRMNNYSDGTKCCMMKNLMYNVMHYCCLVSLSLELKIKSQAYNMFYFIKTQHTQQDLQMWVYITSVYPSMTDWLTRQLYIHIRNIAAGYYNTYIFIAVGNKAFESDFFQKK